MVHGDQPLSQTGAMPAPPGHPTGPPSAPVRRKPPPRPELSTLERELDLRTVELGLVLQRKPTERGELRATAPAVENRQDCALTDLISRRLTGAGRADTTRKTLKSAMPGTCHEGCPTAGVHRACFRTVAGLSALPDRPGVPLTIAGPRHPWVPRWLDLGRGPQKPDSGLRRAAGQEASGPVAMPPQSWP